MVSTRGNWRPGHAGDDVELGMHMFGVGLGEEVRTAAATISLLPRDSESGAPLGGWRARHTLGTAESGP